MTAKVCSLAIVFWISCAAQSTLKITGVTNGADFRPGFSQRGSVSSIFVTGFDGLESTVNDPLAAPSIGVTVNFVVAPVLSVSSQNGVQRVDIQVPWEGTRDPLYVELFEGGQRASFEGPYTNQGLKLQANWSVWFVDATGHAMVQHADHSPVTPQNPYP